MAIGPELSTEIACKFIILDCDIFVRFFSSFYTIYYENFPLEPIKAPSLSVDCFIKSCTLKWNVDSSLRESRPRFYNIEEKRFCQFFQTLSWRYFLRSFAIRSHIYILFSYFFLPAVLCYPCPQKNANYCM